MPVTPACDTCPTATPRERARLVCFTVFDMAFDWSKLHTALQYFAYSQETCPKTGRSHFQCFGYSTDAQRWGWWQRLLKPHHFEICKGTLYDNDVYCSKEGQLIEWGIKPMGNGLKRGLSQIKECIDNGQSFRKIQRQPELFADCIRYRRALKEYQNDVRLDNMYETGFKKKTVHVYIGEAGCFKSKNVRDQFPMVYSMPDNKMQWAGSYDGQSAVLFDDVGIGSIMSVTDFLRYTDGYPIEAPTKGGFVPWTPEHVFFTSNTHPKQWWPNIDPLQLPAVERRIDVIRVYKGSGDFEEFNGQA